MVDILSDEWLVQANVELREKPCPFDGCEAFGSCRAERKLVVHPAALAGVQFKMSGSHQVVMTCSACGTQARLHE